MSEQEPDETDFRQWEKQAEPFTDDLMAIVNKQLGKMPLEAITFFMIRFLTLYYQVHVKEPEESQGFQALLHGLVDALCEDAREKHRQGDLQEIFTPLQ